MTLLPHTPVRKCYILSIEAHTPFGEAERDARNHYDYMAPVVEE
jgi:hypothetical protein